MGALANAAMLASDRAPYSESSEVRHYRRGKRLQTPEEKHAAPAKAEAKRERKRAKRSDQWFRSMANSCTRINGWQMYR